MTVSNSLLREDRLALSVLLYAGADPARLARWYADNSEHTHTHIATIINDLTSVAARRRAAHRGVATTARRPPLMSETCPPTTRNRGTSNGS